MKQTPLDLADAPQPTFDNLVPGTNAPAVAHLKALGPSSAPVYLWGATGSGKSHLLQAVALHFRERGAQVGWFGAEAGLPWTHDERRGLVVFDDCERLSPEQQQAAFSLFAQASVEGTAVVAAGSVPPVDLPLREDLRTRLAWGHVFALKPLSEAEVRAVLRRQADGRGVFLSDEVMDYLLTRFERDLKHLSHLLRRLDDYSLSNHRAITVPLLKQMLSQEGPE
jgi:DnaA-homolog protein